MARANEVRHPMAGGTSDIPHPRPGLDGPVAQHEIRTADRPPPGGSPSGGGTPLRVMRCRPAPAASGEPEGTEDTIALAVSTPPRERPSLPGRAWGRSSVRHLLLVLAALVLAATLFVAGAWWASAGPESVVTTAGPAMVTGVVHDVGAAGVNLRSATQVLPDTARETAARGARLLIECGQSGDVVTGNAGSTGTWLKTSDGLFVSLLYVRVSDRSTVVSCEGHTADLPLIPVTVPGGDGAVSPASPGYLGGGGGEGCAAACATSAEDGKTAPRVVRPSAQVPGGGGAAAANPNRPEANVQVGSGVADPTTTTTTRSAPGPGSASNGGDGGTYTDGGLFPAG